MTALQILVDGFAISALYGVGAVGFTLIFGVSGVLNLAHGALMVVAAVIASDISANYGGGPFEAAAVGILAGFVYAMLTFFLIVRPIQRSRAIQSEEKEIFVLTGTLLWGLMTQQAISYFYTNNPRTVLPLIEGVVDILGVRTPINEILTAVISWTVIGLLWVVVQKTRTGKVLLAASMNARGVTLLGFEMSRIYLATWAIYGVLAGLAGVLLGAFLGVSSDSIGSLTASAFSIVVLGGLGSVSGSLIAAYIVGYIETITAYTVAPSVRTLPVLALLVLVVYMRPQGLLGRR